MKVTYGLTPRDAEFDKQENSGPLYEDTNIREALLFCCKFVDGLDHRWHYDWKQPFLDKRLTPDRAEVFQRNGVWVLSVSDGIRSAERKLVDGMVPFMNALLATMKYNDIIRISFAYTSMLDDAVKHYKENSK